MAQNRSLRGMFSYGKQPESKMNKDLDIKTTELTALTVEFEDYKHYHQEYKRVAERSNVLLLQQLKFSREKATKSPSSPLKAGDSDEFTISTSEVSSLFDKIFLDPDVMVHHKCNKVEKKFYVAFKEATLSQMKILLERMKTTIQENKSLNSKLQESELSYNGSKKRFTCLVTEISDRLTEYLENTETQSKGDYLRILHTAYKEGEDSMNSKLIGQFIDTLIAEARMKWLVDRIYTAQDAKLAMIELQATLESPSPSPEGKENEELHQLFHGVVEYLTFHSKRLQVLPSTMESITVLQNLSRDTPLSSDSTTVLSLVRVYEEIESLQKDKISTTFPQELQLSTASCTGLDSSSPSTPVEESLEYRKILEEKEAQDLELQLLRQQVTLLSRPESGASGTTLYYTTLYSILHYTILHYTLYYTTLYYTILYRDCAKGKQCQDRQRCSCCCCRSSCWSGGSSVRGIGVEGARAAENES